MTKRTPILYSILFITYLFLAFTLFPVILYNASIPLIPLIVLGSWLFGRRFGLLLLLCGLIYFFILYECYADIYLHYYERLLAPLLCLAAIGLVGTLRHNLGAIREANLKLDQLVEERSNELAALAGKLINDSEERRVYHGQWLHDGIGQHLTGIQLFCSSLADQLLEESNPSASIAYTLRKQAHVTHNQIRQIARMLFPIKIGEVGLISALHELSSCFADLENVDFSITELGELPELPEHIALQLYRICQENANYAFFQLRADQINIQIHATQQAYVLRFGHNGISKADAGGKILTQLIDYRLELIAGTAGSGYSVHCPENIIYTIPNPELGIVE